MLAVVVFARFLIDLNALVDGLIDSLELNRKLMEGRGRGNSVEDDRTTIKLQEFFFFCLSESTNSNDGNIYRYSSACLIHVSGH